jgi:diguanylate cyclase (GGDEF)-like protein/PAS domain S-box-containing protein
MICSELLYHCQDDEMLAQRLTGKVCQILFDHVSEGVMLTDAAANILAVNGAFCDITGHTAAEVLGKTPAMLRSSHHMPEFYQQMWRTILDTGNWQGRIWNRRKDDSVYQQWMKITAVYNCQQQITHYLAVFQDLSQLRLHDSQKQQLLTIDNLTGLGNRELLVTRFSHLLAHCRMAKTSLNVIWIDGGQLAHINQQHGLKVGDLLIQFQAKALRAILEPGQTLVRLYADDFMLLSVGTNATETVDELISRLLHCLSQPFTIEDTSVCSTPAIGVARYPLDGDNEEQLLHAAESALEQAKQQGGGVACFYNVADGDACIRKQQIRQSLSQQLLFQGSELTLHFQPKFSITQGRLCGAEALLRWSSAEFGPLSPSEFIAIAEESRLIVQLDRWVIASLCRTVRSWMLDDTVSLPLISFNVSAKQLAEEDFADWLLDCLQAHQVSPRAFELEVTESAFINNPARAVALLSRLKQCGLRIALDDFGIGYSSLVYLKDLPLDTVKIDRSVVSDINSNAKSECIVRNLYALLQDLQLTMVVEGVETAAQHRKLKQLGCDFVQGFYYAKPMPAKDFQSLLQQSNGISTLC